MGYHHRVVILSPHLARNTHIQPAILQLVFKRQSFNDLSSRSRLYPPWPHTTMFKWSKFRFGDQPSTPKLSSVSLPDDGPIKRMSTPQWHPDPEKKSKILSTYPDAGRRSKTPHPVSSKHHLDMAGGQTARTRTVSLSSRIADGTIIVFIVLT